MLDANKIEKLNENNYIAWKAVMEAVLDVQGVWAAVFGDVATEIEGGSTESAHLRSDRLARNLMVLHVSYSFHHFVRNATTAKIAWAKIEAYFKGKQEPRKLFLERDFDSLKQGAAESVEVFFGRAQTFKEQLEFVGVTVSDDRLLNRLLLGVHSRFVNVLDAVAGIQDLKIEELKARLLTVESRVGVDNRSPYGQYQGDNAKGLVVKSVKFPGKCNSCGEDGHKARHCKVPCEYCGRCGHNIKVCYTKQEHEGKSPAPAHASFARASYNQKSDTEKLACAALDNAMFGQAGVSFAL